MDEARSPEAKRRTGWGLSGVRWRSKEAWLWAVLCLGALVPVSTDAEDAAAPARWAVGARGGTIGVGGEVAWAAADGLTLRLVAHGGQFDHDERIRDVRYGVDLGFANAGLLADVHAPDASFRVTLGVFHSADEWSGRARPERPTRIGGLTFSPADIGTIRAEADTPTTVAYAGIGFGNPFRGGQWTVTMDVGVWWFLARPEVRLTADGRAAGFWLFEEALEEEERRIADWLPRWWPVLMLGISYRFG